MKKFLALICCGFLSFFMLAGCSLFELNRPKYYNEIVASVTLKIEDTTETLKFTKKDLIQAYNSYGYQYAQNATNEAELKTAVEKTIEAMVDRQILLTGIKRVVTLSDEDVWSIKTELYKYLDDSIAQFETEVLIDWDMDKNSPNAEEDKEPLRTPKTKYESKVEAEYDELGNLVSLKRVQPKKEKVENPGEWKQKINDEKVSKEAYKRFIKSLQKAAKEEGRSEKEEDVFNYEYNRVYKLLEENKYIEIYQELLEFGNGTEAFPGANINTDEVVEKFKFNFNRDKELYANDLDAYHKKMASDDSVVYYRPNAESAAYVNVNQILLGFSDEQKEMLQTKQKQIEAETGVKKENWNEDITKIYENYRNQLAQNIVVKYETENGEIKTKSPLQVISEIQNALTGSLSLEQKAVNFDNFIYMYNDDPGVVNADFNYAVNLSTDVEDKMVKEFADAARDLNKENADGGNISGLVLTDFGYHILFNAGVAKNIVENVNAVTWQKLYNTKLNPASDKNWFNYIYDSLTDNSVSNGVNSMLESTKTYIVKGEYKIIEKSYKDMWKGKI